MSRRVLTHRESAPAVVTRAHLSPSASASAGPPLPSEKVRPASLKTPKTPSSPRRRTTPERLRALLLRLLFVRESAVAKSRRLSALPAAAPSAPSASPTVSAAPEVSDNTANVNFSRPLARPVQRFSTYRDLDDVRSTDDARSTAYCSEASSESSGARTLRNSITSHDSGFFEALEFPAATRLLTRLQGSSPRSTLSRSSCSSLTIYYTPAEQTITPAQQHALLRGLHALRQVLTQQAALTSRLSKNLAHLFAVKEQQICCLKSASDDAKERAIVALTRLRQLVGKALIRKVVLAKRGATLLDSLEAHLLGTEDGVDLPLELIKGAIGSASQARRTSKSAAAATAAAAGALRWDLKKIEESFVVLRDDLEMQQALDAALREGILGPVTNFKYYKMAVQERVQMRQFAQFVGEELARFQALYARWDKGLATVDRVLGGVA